jgi:hypothetical protein
VVANSPIEVACRYGQQDHQLFPERLVEAAALPALDQYKVDARPVSTGGHPATLTMAMTGQIDIGRGAAPFGLDLVERARSA